MSYRDFWKTSYLIKILADRRIIVLPTSFLNTMTALFVLDSAIMMRLGKNEVALKLACWGHVATIKPRLRQKNSWKAWLNTAKQYSIAI